MSYWCKVVSVTVFLTLFWLPLTAVAAQHAPVVVNVAKVGNMLITQADVDRRTQQILPMQVSFHGSLSNEKVAGIKQEALNQLISRAYKVQYAIEEEVSVDAATFESEWKKKLEKNPQLAKYAHTPQVSKIRADFYLELLARKAEKLAVDDKVSVTDQQVSAFYKENKERYFRPKQFTASHIFVKVDPAENAEEKQAKLARAEELYKRAKKGEDFYNLAYYESDDRSRYVGGSLGSFHAGQTVPEFDAAIKAMKPGEISRPVRTIYGYHVIKLDAVEAERQLLFEEVAAKIRSSFVADEREKLYEQWMQKLKAKYPIEQFN